jgi:capsular polysaccharide biosynthesis protein
MIGFSPEEMALNTVSTVVLPDTNILEISVDGSDRRRVAEVANAVAAQAVVYSRQFYQVYELRTLDPAPTLGKRKGPDLIRQLVAGGLLGLLIGLAAAFLLSQFRRPVREEDGLPDDI